MNAQLQTQKTPKTTSPPSYKPVSRGLLQRTCACGAHSSGGGECTSCREKRERSLQRAAVADGPASAPPIVQDVLRSPGQPLDPAMRTFMEPRFGHDFSRVRVHTGAQAAESAQAVNALAYTVGRDIVFDAGRYAPATTAGRRLLAHELTHTIQQSQASSAGVQMASSIEVAEPDTSYEREAEAQATEIVEGRAAAPVGVLGRLGVARLQRQADISQAPAGLPCVLTTGPGHLPGTDVMFDISSTVLSGTARTDIAAFASAWVAGGSKDDVIVDGWASTDGPQPLNWRLSCERAEAVKTELGARGVPSTKVTTLAHGESTEFSATDLTKNRRAIITRQPAVGPTPPTPTPPTPTPPTPTPPTPETITSETVAVTPGPRTRTKIGVGEEVTLTHTPGSTRWATSGPGGRIRGLLSSDTGDTVILTAPDTAQTITVTAGTAALAFDVIAPNDVHMDREPSTGVMHELNRPTSGIRTRVFLGPDTVNFNKVIYHELDVAGVATPGVYSCNPFSGGHCGAGGGGAACPDKDMTSTVLAGLGTQSRLGDCATSGDCCGIPLAAGSV